MRFDKIKFINFYVPALLFAISFVWKLFYIDARDICLDEPFTIFHAQSSVIDIIKLPSKNEPNPPLFMLLLHFWIKLFGISPYSVRILPILFNAVTAVFIYLTGKRFFGLWSGITASGMFILSTYHFYFGADTRTYSMLSMATAASLYYLFSLVKNPEKKKYLVALIISNLVLVYGHYFGWLVVFIELLVSMFYYKNLKILKKTALAVLATFILYTPMFMVMINQFFISKESTWVVPPPAYEYLHQIQSFINSRKGLRILGYLLGSGILLSIFTKISPDRIKELTILFLWWFVPYTFMFFISFRIPMFTDRYVLFNSVGFYLFIGVAIAYLFRRIKFVIPLLSIGMLFLMWWYMETQDYAPRKIKMAANYIHSKSDTETVIVILPHWVDLEFMYHFNNEIFGSVENYEELLEKNKIFRAWGLEDTKNNIITNLPQKVIFYSNNTHSPDPENTIFNYFDENYIRIDSAHFEEGIEISVFKSR